jgi:predicted metal-dependent phosphoesterase TrpH
MPARQPFTALCQSLRRHRPAGWYDLHLHTTHSDGLYRPAELVDLARRAGLSGIAITDHDTLSAVPEAIAATRGSEVEVIPGVEVTAEFQGHELHLLGYFIREDDAELREALERLRHERRGRFAEMVDRLKQVGVTLEPADLPDASAGEALGRRNLANALVRAQRVGSVREAFARYLGDGGRVAVPKARLPVAEAIALVRGAGGVAAWDHPSYDALQAGLGELCRLGLDAVEADYPTRRASQVRNIRALAHTFGLAVTGGSDCHGPEPLTRALGRSGVTGEELDRLRAIASERRAAS